MTTFLFLTNYFALAENSLDFKSIPGPDYNSKKNEMKNKRKEK